MSFIAELKQTYLSFIYPILVKFALTCDTVLHYLFYNFYKSLVENWNFISFGGNHYGDNYIRYKIYDGRSNVVAAYEDLLDIYRYITPEKENMTKEEVFNEMEETILNEIVDKIKRRV